MNKYTLLLAYKVTLILNLNLGSCCFFASLLHQLRGPTAPPNPAHSVHGQQQHQLHTPHHWQQQEWAQPRVCLGQHQNFLTTMFHSWNWVLITAHKPFSPSSLFKQSFPFPKFIVNWKLKEFVQLSFKIQCFSWTFDTVLLQDWPTEKSSSDVYLEFRSHSK